MHIRRNGKHGLWLLVNDSDKRWECSWCKAHARVTGTLSPYTQFVVCPVCADYKQKPNGKIN